MIRIRRMPHAQKEAERKHCQQAYRNRLRQNYPRYCHIHLSNISNSKGRGLQLYPVSDIL